MNEITAITPQIKDKKRCNIFIDGRFCCGLTLETTVKHRLKVGQTVSVERLAEIQLESEKSVALDKALTHISATRKTEKQVRDFLAQKGYLPVVADHVIEKMKGYGFLNDAEYAEEYASFAGAKKGKRLIRMELKGKGVSDTELENALDCLDEETQVEAARRILEKYMRGKPPVKETLFKAFRYLLGKGFEADTAKRALSEFGECEDE